MSDGDAQAASTGDKPGLVEQLRANPRLSLIFGVAAAAAILIALVLWSSGPRYGVLFSGLSDRDGGNIVAQLDQMQVPYKFASGGSTIMVPQAKVDRIRLKLAGQGLPQGGGVGFKLMDDQPLGISKFAEHINFQRAMQGELANTIESLATVASARVSLAIPKSSVFVREREDPTASVVLDLYSGRALSDGQVTAITHLVASSVPGLPADLVTVVNSDGDLLSRPNNANGVSASQLEYSAKVEQIYRNKIQALLTPIVGETNFRVRVSADMNYASNEQTRERYAPNQAPGKQAVRSRQSNMKSNGGGAGASGVPGALSNKPAPDAKSPINNPKKTQQQTDQFLKQTRLANQNNQASGARRTATGTSSTGGGASGPMTRSTVTNYEVNHTIEHVKKPVGRLRRVSAAIVINDAIAPGDAGDTGDEPGANPPVQLTDAQLDQVKTLVRGAIGFSSTRGDAVEIIQIPFSHQASPEAAPEPSFIQRYNLVALLTQLFKYLVVAVVAWLLWQRLVKPLLARSSVPALPGAPAASGAAEAQPPAPEAGAPDPEREAKRQRARQQAKAIKNSRDLARDDPRMVAMIIKNWMTGRE